MRCEKIDSRLILADLRVPEGLNLLPIRCVGLLAASLFSPSVVLTPKFNCVLLDPLPVRPFN